jgi:hypothetical protein
LSSFAAAGFVVFILVLFAGIYLGLFGLPGAVVIFLDVLVYALVTGFAQVGWKVMLFLLFAAVLAEPRCSGRIHLILRRRRQPALPGSVAAGAGRRGRLAPLLGSGIWIGFFLGGLAVCCLRNGSGSPGSLPPIRPRPGVSGPDGLRAGKGFLSLVMIFVSLSNIYS